MRRLTELLSLVVSVLECKAEGCGLKPVFRKLPPAYPAKMDTWCAWEGTGLGFAFPDSLPRHDEPSSVHWTTSRKLRLFFIMAERVLKECITSRKYQDSSIPWQTNKTETSSQQSFNSMERSTFRPTSNVGFIVPENCHCPGWGTKLAVFCACWQLHVFNSNLSF